jgi:pimeloyl-ACP methyl ester carboxylesterase
VITDLVVTAHDGIDLAVRDHGGEGPDLLFLHGALRTLEDWGPVLSHMSGVRAVTMDLRSHGRSDVPNPGGWDDFVRDVETVVDRLELADPVVVGHSFGGVLAMAYAAKYPGARSVINIDGFDFREREILDAVDPAEVDRFIENFRKLNESFPPDTGDDVWLEGERRMLQQMGASWKVPGDFFAACFDRAYVRGANGWERRPPNSFFDSINYVDGWADPLAILRRVECPVVFVVCRPPGESGVHAEARKGLERHIGTMAAEKANVRLETIDGTHWVMFERPDAIAAIIRTLPGG